MNVRYLMTSGCWDIVPVLFKLSFGEPNHKIIIDYCRIQGVNYTFSCLYGLEVEIKFNKDAL